MTVSDKQVTEFWLNDGVLLRVDGIARMMPGEAISIGKVPYWATKVGWAIDYASDIDRTTVRCNVELSERRP